MCPTRVGRGVLQLDSLDNGSKFTMGVEATSTATGRGRDSVRITSKAKFNDVSELYSLVWTFEAYNQFRKTGHLYPGFGAHARRMWYCEQKPKGECGALL